MKQVDRVASALFLFLALFIIYHSLQLPYLDRFGPGSGFMPLWLAVLLGVLSVMLLFSTFAPSTDSSDWRPDKRAIVVTVIAGVAVFLSNYVGMILTSALLMGSILFYLEPAAKKRNLTISLITPVAVWLLFTYWLGVPMPRGPLGF